MRELRRAQISASDAEQNFSELLDRVDLKHESFAIVRDGVEVCHVTPVIRHKANLRPLIERLRRLPPLDSDFAQDLEQIRKDQPPMDPDPWDA